ncbi:HLA class II histocompatibility antigen gamma chain, partial [Pygoscelis antarcticus]
MAGFEGVSSSRWPGLSSLSMSCRSALGHKAALSTLSILVALLIAGQAVTVYFVYQQNGQISKLSRASQTLQLEALQRKMPASAKPVSKMKIAMMSMPRAMQALPLDHSAGDMVRDAHRCLALPAALGARRQPLCSCCFFVFSLEDTAPASNKTEDQVKHLLLQADPRKMFPELKDNLMDNLKSLKNTMTDVDWKSFESWMHKWLLFEMAKNPKPEDRKAIPAEKAPTPCPPSADAATVEPEEMMFSGVEMLKLGAEK